VGELPEYCTISSTTRPKASTSGATPAIVTNTLSRIGIFAEWATTQPDDDRAHGLKYRASLILYRIADPL
jgi:hypothetical protein